MRVCWTARRSNQSTLAEINPEYSWKGLMLKLKLQYLGRLMQRPNSLEKTPCWERLRQEETAVAEGEMLDGITKPMDMSLSKLWDSEGQGSLVCCSLWDHKESDMT